LRPFLRSTRLAAGMLLLVVLVWVAPRRAEGFCQGRREGIRLYAEYLGRKIERRVLESCFDLLQIVNGFSELPINLSLWSLHIQARAALSEMLVKAAAGQDDGRPSYENIRAALQPFWNKAAIIQRTFKQTDVDPKTALADKLADIVIRWSACQSLASRSSLPCDLAGALDPRRRKGCRLDLARLAVLYSGNGRGKLATQAAEILGMDPAKLAALCEILKKRQAARCREFGDFDYLCQAFCAEDESACRAKQLPEKQTRECVRDLYVFETITGKISMEDFTKRYPESRYLYLLPALLGVEDCLLSALQNYDRGAVTLFMHRKFSSCLPRATP